MNKIPDLPHLSGLTNLISSKAKKKKKQQVIANNDNQGLLSGAKQESINDEASTDLLDMVVYFIISLSLGYFFNTTDYFSK